MGRRASGRQHGDRARLRYRPRSLRAAAKRGIVSETFAGNGDEIWTDGATWVPEATYVRTDAAANRGDSGSPLLDTCGKVVGVFLALHVSPGVEGVRYAIAGTTAQASLQDVRDAGLPPDPAAAAAAIRGDFDLIYDWWAYFIELTNAPKLRDAEDALYTLYLNVWYDDYSDYSRACERASEWVSRFAYHLSWRAALYALWYEQDDPADQDWIGDAIDTHLDTVSALMLQAEYHIGRCDPA